MSKRLDKIKAARSLNEILEVVSDIAYEFKNSSAVVSRIVSSLSATLVMDMRNQQPSKVTDTTFKPPKLTELKKHVEVVHKLYENVLELDAAEAMMKQAFAGNKKLPAALASIKALKTDIDNSINDAFAALGDIAAKHVPSKLSKLVDSVTSHIIDVLPTKTYKNVSRQLYVVPDPTEAGIFHFCEYIGIDGLKNQQGFTYDQYFIIVTGVVQKNGAMVFHVNGLPDFKSPGRYPLGKQILDLKGAKQHVNLLLDHNNFVTDFEKKPMPIDTERANTAGFTALKGVASVKVVDDELIVVLAPGLTERQLKATELDIRARLNSVVGARRNDTVFQSKLVRSGSKQALKFILVPNVGRKMNVSLERLDEVAHLMNLTDAQKSALRFAIQH